ncbi:hypothetical protein GCM10027037_18880 [Mucilaginibacter koreensis]
MIIYNETYVVNPEVNETWLAWIKQNHIPGALSTGLFNSYKILTVLNSPNEGVTYCIQFVTDQIEKYTQFTENHLDQLHIVHNQQFENQYVLFNSIMQLLEEHAA